MKKKEKKIKYSSGADSQSEGDSASRKRAGAFSLSIILHFIERLTNSAYNALINGIFGIVFTSYSAEQRAFERGAVKGYFTGNSRVERIFRNTRQSLSKAFETSFLMGWIDRGLNRLLSTPLKLYGNFLLSFGLYSALVYVVRIFLPTLVTPDLSFLVTSFVMILASLPLLASRVSLASAVGKGRILRLILIEAFGFKEEDFELTAVRRRGRLNGSIIWGMAAGIATVFLHPAYIIAASLFLAVMAMIIATPEMGVVLSIFMIPFCSFLDYPSAVLIIFVLVTTCGYVIKLVRGKRILKLEILDLMVLIFGLVLFMSGVITAGGVASFAEACVCCVLLLGFFLVTNLMRTERWLNRCVNAVVGSSVIVSVIGVVQYVMGYAVLDWLDTSYFGDIEGRVVSLFDNPNVLAAYLVISFPLLLAKASDAKDRREKLLAMLSIITVVSCTVLTWSRGAWVAMIVSVVVMSLINNRKTFKWLMAVCAAMPAVAFLLPRSVVRRFLSIGDLADSSSYYRVYTWRGTLSAISDHFWSGAGYGMSAYAEIYPQYAYAGIEAAIHSHNLFLQILFSCGIFGLLIFLAVIFFFSQKSFESIKKNKMVKLPVSAIFSAVLGALVIGMFDYVWYSYRIFFMFWIMIGLCCAYVRFGEREMQRVRGAEKYCAECASIDL